MSQKKTLSVLIVSAYFPPASLPGVHRVIRFARHLREDGWPVSVITMDPIYFDRYARNDETLLEQVADGVCVHRTKVFRGLKKISEVKERLRWTPKKPMNKRKPASTAGTKSRPTAWQRLKEWVIDIVTFPDRDIGWFWYAVRQGRELLERNRVDVILSTAPPHTSHLVAANLSRRFNIAWVADFRDPMARIPFYWSRKGKRLKKARWERLEKRIVAKADAVILNTDRMKKEFENVYGEKVYQKLYCVTNGFDSELFKKYEEIEPAQGDRLIITHAGSLYGSRNPIALFEAMALAIAAGRIPKEGIRLNLLGSYVRDWGLPEKMDELTLGSVVNLLAAVPHRECLMSMAASHVLLVIQPESIIQVPAKLYEYMALRRPILALAPEGAVGDLIREGNLGILVPPTDVPAIANALCSLYEQRHSLASKFCHNDGYRHGFEGKALTRRLESILNWAKDQKEQWVGA